MPNGEMEVKNPRRILAISLESETQQLTRVIKELTGSSPEPVADSLAGTTHELHLETPYYKATVPLWLDLIASPSEWAASFLSPEAGEVLAVLGGLVLVFGVPPSSSSKAVEQTRDLVRHVGKVVEEGLGGWEWEGVGIAVGVGEGDSDEWDEACASVGIEFVHLTGREPVRNEFGEKTGIARVKQAFEANDWSQLDDLGAASLSDFGDFEDGKDDDALGDEADLDPENMDFGFDKADFEGMRAAIWGADVPGDGQNTEMDAKVSPSKEEEEEEKKTSKEKFDANNDTNNTTGKSVKEKEDLDEEEVAKMERMMMKLQAVREAGDGMSEDQRRRMAARAVQEVMKEM